MKSNAARVMSLAVVPMDLMFLLESPLSVDARALVPCSTVLLCCFTNAGILQLLARGTNFSKDTTASLWQFEYRSEGLPEVVYPDGPWVGLPDPCGAASSSKASVACVTTWNPLVTRTTRGYSFGH